MIEPSAVWDHKLRKFVTCRGELIEHATKKIGEAILCCILCGDIIDPGVDPGDGFIGKEVACGHCIRRLVSPDAHLGAVEN